MTEYLDQYLPDDLSELDALDVSVPDEEADAEEAQAEEAPDEGEAEAVPEDARQYAIRAAAEEADAGRRARRLEQTLARLRRLEARGSAVTPAETQERDQLQRLIPQLQYEVSLDERSAHFRGQPDEAVTAALHAADEEILAAIPRTRDARLALDGVAGGPAFAQDAAKRRLDQVGQELMGAIERQLLLREVLQRRKREADFATFKASKAEAAGEGGP